MTPKVFTTLENGTDDSPTERQSTGRVPLLDDGLQRSSSVFCSLSFTEFIFSLSTFVFGNSGTQHFSTDSAQTQVQLVGMSTVRNRWQKRDNLHRTYQ